MSAPLSVIDTAALAEMDRYGVSIPARWLYAVLPLAGTDSARARFCADPEFLCATFFAANVEVTTAGVERWMGELSRAELIRVTGTEVDAEGVILGRLGHITRRLERGVRR